MNINITELLDDMKKKGATDNELVLIELIRDELTFLTNKYKETVLPICDGLEELLRNMILRDATLVELLTANNSYNNLVYLKKKYTLQETK